MGRGARAGVFDPGELEEIDTAECWRLLATQAVGRIAVVDRGYPLVFPVNFALDGQSILFWTAPGTKLWALRRGKVGFEVDELDPAAHGGWSVMVKGSALEMTTENNPNLVARSRAAGATPWAPGARSHLVRVVAEEVTGRRIPSSGGAPGR